VTTGLDANNPYCSSASFTLGQVVEVTSSTIGSPTWTTLTNRTIGSVLPPALQVCISWSTTLAARRARGRTFVGPLNTLTQQTDGTPTPTHVAAIQAAADGIATRNQALNGWAVAIWGLQDKQNWPLPAGTQPEDLPHVARDITGAKIRDQFAVLRSRRD
jgi:hypothetical protein